MPGPQYLDCPVCHGTGKRGMMSADQTLAERTLLAARQQAQLPGGRGGRCPEQAPTGAGGYWPCCKAVGHGGAHLGPCLKATSETQKTGLGSQAGLCHLAIGHEGPCRSNADINANGLAQLAAPKELKQLAFGQTVLVTPPNNANGLTIWEQERQAAIKSAAEKGLDQPCWTSWPNKRKPRCLLAVGHDGPCESAPEVCGLHFNDKEYAPGACVGPKGHTGDCSDSASEFAVPCPFRIGVPPGQPCKLLASHPGPCSFGANQEPKLCQEELTSSHPLAVPGKLYRCCLSKHHQTMHLAGCGMVVVGLGPQFTCNLPLGHDGMHQNPTPMGGILHTPREPGTCTPEEDLPPTGGYRESAAKACGLPTYEGPCSQPAGHAPDGGTGRNPACEGPDPVVALTQALEVERARVKELREELQRLNHGLSDMSELLAKLTDPLGLTQSGQ